jgi:hypothetical protein
MTPSQRWRLVLAATAGAAALWALAGIVLVINSASDSTTDPPAGIHWHAPYEIYIGGQLQPPIPETITPQGIHTHGDGIIHIHPPVEGGEFVGVKITVFFSDQGGRLSETELRIPGAAETYRVGDLIDGRPASLRILRADSGIHPLGANFSAANAACNAMPESAFEQVTSRYAVQDGDCIRIIFGGSES